jgi:hypothetical protein
LTGSSRISPEKGGRDSEALAHPEGEAPDAATGDRLESGQRDDLVDAFASDAAGGGEGQEVVLGGPPGVHGLRVEQHADFAQGRAEIDVVGTVDGDRAAGRAVEPDDQSHRRRLAGAVGPEEAGDDAGLHREADVVDGQLLPVTLRETYCFDHAGVLMQPG